MRPALVASLLLLLAGATQAQTAAAPEAPLSDFVGTYADAKGSRLEIALGETLFAVIDEAKYPLKRMGQDRFKARSGDEVQFTRDAAGQVNGYLVKNLASTRLSPDITRASRDLAWPRPDSPGHAPAYRYQAPPALGDGLSSGDATASDFSASDLERIVQGVLDGRWPDVHAILIHQRGRLILEEYFYGYDRARPHQMRSATKSVVSALAGIAAARPGAAAVDSPVLPRLPYGGLSAYANPDPRKAEISLAQLLTMRSGLACNDYDAKSPGNETTIYESPDWVKAAMDLPMAAAPGGPASYCSAGVAVVGRLIERAVGLALPEFADRALFAPLGIQRGDWRWNYQLTQANREFSQIHLRPRDLLKFGLLYAQGGRWQDKQVLAADWVKASLESKTSIGGTGYGYFWWRPWLQVDTPGGPRRVEFSAAQGNGGQKIYIVPQHELVVVFTGGDYNSGGSPPNKIMAGVILPAALAAAARRDAER